jgi:heme exporter protein D
MESLTSLMHMGGYGGYVWPAYGLSVVVLAAVLVVSLMAARSSEAELELLQRSRRANRDAGKNGNTEISE